MLNKKTLVCALCVVMLCNVIILPAVCQDASYGSSNELSETDYGAWIGGIIAVIVAFCICAWVLGTRCPKCGRYFAAVKTGSRILGQEGGYRDVVRDDRVFDTNKNEMATIKRTEQVHVVRTKYENYYRCKHCNHGWGRVSYSERQG